MMILDALLATIFLQPGNCVETLRARICATEVQQRQFSEDDFQAETWVCQLSQGKSPNTWDLFRSGGRRGKKALVQSFPHFERDKCEMTATIQNNKE